MTAPAPTSASDRELVLTRIIDVPADKLFKCWTTPELLPKWFCPPPWGVSHAEMDVRTGGSSLIVMRGPNGEEMPNAGVYLEVVQNRRLVFTDAFTSAWVPSEKPFMVGDITFEDLGDGTTRYTAIARHWSVEDRKTHEQMGFHEGWGVCADQMAALARTL
jgi:uncharacterized protein YndB with AHSA1/START domain